MEQFLDIVATFLLGLVFLLALETVLRGNVPYEKELYSPSETQTRLIPPRKTRQSNYDFQVHSTSSGSNGIDHFPLMSLPLELRRKIWTFCLPGPRILEADDDFSSSPEWKFKSSGTDLKILHVCYESRSLALEHYHPLFKVDTPMGYFDPKIDTLYFSSGAHLFENDFQRYHVFKQIRCIVLLASPYSLRMMISVLSGPHRQWPLQRLVLFENLEKIYIAIENFGTGGDFCSCRLESITEAGDISLIKRELFDEVEAFGSGLDAVKELRGLERVPAVVPARCITPKDRNQRSGQLPRMERGCRELRRQSESLRRVTCLCCDVFD